VMNPVIHFLGKNLGTIGLVNFLGKNP